MPRPSSTFQKSFFKKKTRPQPPPQTRQGVVTDSPGSSGTTGFFTRRRYISYDPYISDILQYYVWVDNQLVYNDTRAPDNKIFGAGAYRGVAYSSSLRSYIMCFDLIYYEPIVFNDGKLLAFFDPHNTACWNGSSTMIDQSGNNNHAYFNVGPPPVRTVFHNGAMMWSRQQGAIVPTLAGYDYQSAFTVCIWAYNNGANLFRSLVTQGAAGFGGFDIFFQDIWQVTAYAVFKKFYANGQPYPSGEISILRMPRMPVNQWLFLAMVVEGDFLKFYLNGNYIDGRSRPNGLRVSANPVSIGTRAPNILSSPYQGPMGRIRIYDKSLSQFDVQELYSNDLSIYSPPPQPSIVGDSLLFNTSWSSPSATFRASFTGSDYLINSGGWLRYDVGNFSYNSGITICAWIRLDATNSFAVADKAHTFANRSNPSGWFLEAQYNQIRFTIHNGPATGLFVCFYNTPLYRHFFVTVSFLSRQPTFYINGARVPAQGISFSPWEIWTIRENSSPLYVGARKNYLSNVNNITGMGTRYIRSLQIYSRRLSDEEVYQNFNAGRGQFGY